MSDNNDPMLSQGIEPTSGLEPQLWTHIKPNCHVLIRVAWRSWRAFVDHSIEEGHIYFDDHGAVLLFKESVLLPRDGLYDFELRIFDEYYDVYAKLRAVQRHFSIKLNRVEGDQDMVAVKRILLWKIPTRHEYINRGGLSLRNE